MNTVITISREFGSGGRTIGKKVAERLGIPYIDSEIVQRVVDESGFSKEYVEQQDEVASSAELLVTSNVFSTTYYDMPQKQIYEIQSKYIIEKAKEGPCVIVGRCSDYVLENTDIDHLSIFIFANIEKRMERVVKEYGETDINIEKRVKKKDKQRKKYYRYYTGRDFGEVENFDICLNSGKLGIDNCVDFIVQAVK